ncbi:MAG: hypothetical protein WAX66_00235 [Patescibacteria group bacterium]
MIIYYLTNLISSREILTSIIVSLISIAVCCYYLFKNRSFVLFIKSFISFSLSLILSIFLLRLSFVPVFYLSKDLNNQFFIVSTMFFLFYFVSLVIKYMVSLKNALFKGKKTSSLKEALNSTKKENISRVATLFVFLSVFLLSIVFIGYGRINILAVLLFISGILSSLSCVFILPLFLKISEKVFK